jgi:Ser/Thr protein kinase RdoA (MazF antagonist)
MHPQLLATACQLYSTSPDLLIPLSGGYSNAVYQFPQGKKHAILRIGVEDCPPDQTLGMLEWVRFLSDEGAPVVAPVLSTKGQLLENLEFEGKRYTLTAFERAVGTLAENIPPTEWSDDLFHSIGKAVGKFHRISRRYQPSSHTLTRPMLFDAYEILEATNLLANSSDPAREKLASLISELKLLPTDPPDFGLIHDDLHFANFLIQPDGQVAIIDFDDCAYGWFAIDVAMALFDVLVLYNPTNEADKQRFALRFMSSYLSGYHLENDLPIFWQSQIPHFLKLKELCIYATLVGFPDIDQADTWGGRFMRGRSTRVANEVPYVDIDFSDL